MSETQLCPICGTELAFSARYPKYLCAACCAGAADETGRKLSFFNVSFSGGFAARYADNGAERDGHICYINGRKCWADEARFGGIVIQPYDGPD